MKKADRIINGNYMKANPETQRQLDRDPRVVEYTELESRREGCGGYAIVEITPATCAAKRDCHETGRAASGYYCEGVWISLAERGDDECPQCGTSYHADFYRHHGAAK